MARRPHIPEALTHGPFTRAQARAAGLTDRQLQSRCWRRIFPGVWAWDHLAMSGSQWRHAAALALPPDARLTGLTRLHELGLDAGAAFPLRFVIARDHHLDLDRIILHRTERMPPVDAIGVTPAAAYLAVCAESSVLFAAGVGDWLLRRGHVDLIELRELACRERWRAGAIEALWISRFLDGGARSVPETEWRLRLLFAGLPCPQVNVPIRDDAGTALAIGDLAYPQWRTIAEYEGKHHQLDRDQYLTDISRYGELRKFGFSYVQLTHETPAAAGVLAVHRSLRAHGYDGPPPHFGQRWRLLGQRLSRVARSGGSATLQHAGGVDHAPRLAGRG